MEEYLPKSHLQDHQIVNLEDYAQTSFTEYDLNLFTSNAFIKNHGDQEIDVVVQNPFISDFKIKSDKNYQFKI